MKSKLDDGSRSTVIKRVAIGIYLVAIGAILVSMFHLTDGLITTTGDHWILALLLAFVIDFGIVASKAGIITAKLFRIDGVTCAVLGYGLTSVRWFELQIVLGR